MDSAWPVECCRFHSPVQEAVHPPSTDKASACRAGYVQKLEQTTGLEVEEPLSHVLVMIS